LVGGTIAYYATTSSMRDRQKFELKRDAYFEYIKAIYLYREINTYRLPDPPAIEEPELDRLTQKFSEMIGPADFKIKVCGSEDIIAMINIECAAAAASSDERCFAYFIEDLKGKMRNELSEIEPWRRFLRNLTGWWRPGDEAIKKKSWWQFWR
jgi:hypothetical protein